MITLIVPFHLVFTQALAGGYSLLFLVSEKDTGKGFTKIVNGMFLCFLLLSYVFGKYFMKRSGASPALFTAHTFLFVCLFVFLLLHAFIRDLSRSFIAAKGCMFFACLTLLVLAVSYFAFVPRDAFLQVLFFLSMTESSLFLGAASLGMVFGHWYLVKPKMSLEPFKKLTLVFFLSSAVQLLMTALYAASYFLNIPLFEAHHLDRLFRFSDLGIFFVFRLMIGTLASLLLSYLTYTTLASESIPKINRTRAATGLLYIAILSAFTGELIGKYLFWITKIPL